MHKRIAALLGLFLATQANSSLAQIEVKELVTRPGVTVRFVYAKAERPVASAVLLQGGGGNIGIFANGSMRVEGFLSGGAHRFTQNGISVAIPDVPSDRRTLEDFRNTPEHALDNAALIDFLRQQANVPVWAIGTSNGSLSAVAAASHLKGKGPNGLVLTSSVTKEGVSPGMAHLVSLVPLGEIAIPVLLVHHKTDGCYVSPYDGATQLVGALKSAKPVELISIEGGSSGNPCHSGYHQFLGIETSVTELITDWMKRHPLPSGAGPGS